MTNLAIGISSMAVRNLLLSVNISMVAMFACKLLVNMFVRMQRLKQHCKQYSNRHKKIN